jgi:hypothetical protein
VDFSYESFWKKTEIYIQTMLAEEPDNELYAFWAALSLEFLSKATLAYVHPSLVIDTKKSSLGILHVFDYNVSEAAKTIEITTVASLISAMNPQKFDQQMKKSFLSIVERRNHEIHSGGFAFKGLARQSWLIDYYRICKVLVEFQKKSLQDLLGDDALIAEKMIEVAEIKYNKEVKELIEKARTEFEQLPQEEQANLKRLASDKDRYYSIWDARTPLVKEVICPACGTNAYLEGQVIRVSEEQVAKDVYTEIVSSTTPSVELVGEDELLFYPVEEVERNYTYVAKAATVLPARFRCFACKLTLEGFNAIIEEGFDDPAIPGDCRR